MYNRYIPQADGTYRRSQVRDSKPDPTQNDVANLESSTLKQSDESKPMNEIPSAIVSKQRPSQRQYKQRHRDLKQTTNSVGGFLKQLLPQNLDTEDLIVVLLLLLMSEDNQDNQNTALLTLVIYLFL